MGRVFLVFSPSPATPSPGDFTSQRRNKRWGLPAIGLKLASDCCIGASALEERHWTHNFEDRFTAHDANGTLGTRVVGGPSKLGDRAATVSASAVSVNS